jgi:hypothetical protein
MAAPMTPCLTNEKDEPTFSTGRSVGKPRRFSGLDKLVTSDCGVRPMIIERPHQSHFTFLWVIKRLAERVSRAAGLHT